MWLDSGLNFSDQNNERLKKAQRVEARIKGLSKIYGLFSVLIIEIQFAEIQSVAFYGAEIW